MSPPLLRALSLAGRRHAGAGSAHARLATKRAGVAPPYVDVRALAYRTDHHGVGEAQTVNQVAATQGGVKKKEVAITADVDSMSPPAAGAVSDDATMVGVQVSKRSDLSPIGASARMYNANIFSGNDERARVLLAVRHDGEAIKHVGVLMPAGAHAQLATKSAGVAPPSFDLRALSYGTEHRGVAQTGTKTPRGGVKEVTAILDSMSSPAAARGDAKDGVKLIENTVLSPIGAAGRMFHARQCHPLSGSDERVRALLTVRHDAAMGSCAKAATLDGQLAVADASAPTAGRSVDTERKFLGPIISASLGKQVSLSGAATPVATIAQPSLLLQARLPAGDKHILVALNHMGNYMGEVLIQDSDLPAFELKDPVFIGFESEEKLIEFVGELMVTGGAYPNLEDRMSGSFCCMPMMFGEMHYKRPAGKEGINIIKQLGASHRYANNDTSLQGVTASANGMITTAPSMRDTLGGRSFHVAMWYSRSSINDVKLGYSFGNRIARHMSDGATKPSRQRASKASKVDILQESVDNLAAKLEEIEHSGRVDLEAVVIRLEETYKSLDKRISSMEKLWDDRLRVAEKRLEMADKCVEIAEKRAQMAEKNAHHLERIIARIEDHLSVVLERVATTEQMLSSMDEKFMKLAVWLINDQRKQLDEISMKHLMLVDLHMNLMQQFTLQKKTMEAMEHAFRIEILSSKRIVASTAWRIVLVLLGGFGAVTIFYLPYVIKDIKMEAIEESLKRIKDVLEEIVTDAIKKMEEERDARKGWWNRFFK